MAILSEKPELEPVNADPPFKIIERDGKRYIESSEVGDLIEYATEIDEFGGKHDRTWKVCLINIDGTVFEFRVDCSYEYGVNPSRLDVELTPVDFEPVSAWKVVPAKT